MHRLPEDFNGGHFLDILHGGGIYVFQRIVVFFQPHLCFLAEQYARWCERSTTQLMGRLLLDREVFKKS